MIKVRNKVDSIFHASVVVVTLKCQRKGSGEGRPKGEGTPPGGVLHPCLRRAVHRLRCKPT